MVKVYLPTFSYLVRLKNLRKQVKIVIKLLAFDHQKAQFLVICSHLSERLLLFQKKAVAPYSVLVGDLMGEMA